MLDLTTPEGIRDAGEVAGAVKWCEENGVTVRFGQSVDVSAWSRDGRSYLSRWGMDSTLPAAVSALRARMKGGSE